MTPRLIALLAALCILSPLSLAQSASIGPSKITAETWRKVQTGEVHDLLVLFENDAIDAEIRGNASINSIDGGKAGREDDATLNLRALRYQQIKTRATAMLKPHEAEIRKDYRHIPMRLMRFHSTAALQRLLERMEVVAVMEDSRAYLHLTESLPLIGQPAANVMGRTGAGYTVVVVDSGVDYTRSEFGSCTAPGVPASCKVVAAFDTAPDDGQRDDLGHGTGVAGTVRGIAPGANVAAIDAFTGSSANSSDIIEGIDWAIANRTAYGIVAINMSLGDGVRYTSQCSNIFTNPYRQPIINAFNAGILTIVSSGNEGYTNGLASPACTPEAVSVGAVYDSNAGAIGWSACTDSTTAADKVTCFSNSASFLTLLAPGALITVTGNTVGGTSFSAPFVAGAVAVMAQAFTGDSVTTRLNRLTSNGKSVTDSRNGIIKPRLDLLSAQGAPGNDNFSTATTLSGNSGNATGWNYNASKESGEPSHAGNSGGKSVWWQWTAPASGTLNLNTHGSAFDTLLAVYTGNSVATLNGVTSNDNDGAAGNVSGLSTAVASGATYRIAVDGKSATSGTITLAWSLQQAQTITFPAIGDAPLGSAFSLSATASSGLAVSYSSQTPAICTMAGDVVTLHVSGVCAINADQAGSASFLPAPTASRSFNATKLSQSISFAALSNKTLSTPPFSVSATANSGLPVTIVSLSTAVCSIGSNTVTLLTIGTCSLQAQQAGNATYSAATAVTQTLTVAAASSGGSGDGDVPIPAWALAMLGAGLFGAQRLRK